MSKVWIFTPKIYSLLDSAFFGKGEILQRIVNSDLWFDYISCTRLLTWICKIVSIVFSRSLSFVENPAAMKMASYQQRIPLKGTEDSIDYFTDVLKSTKDQVGVNSAEVLLRAMVFWHHGGGFRFLNQFPTSASKRNNGRVSRIFYLQVLTTADIMEKINTELDRVRRGYALKSLLDTQNVGRAEFLLEALIFILEVFKTNRTSINRYDPS